MACFKFGVNSRDEIFAGTFNGIYKSTDGGKTWIIKFSPTTTYSINFIFIDSKDRIYAINSAGFMFYSFDDGRTWYSETTLNALCINEDNEHHLVVGTYTGVFRSIDSIYTDLQKSPLLPSCYSLSQNYPNPFNPNTVISYQLPVAGHVTLKVYDVLGKEVATLVDEVKAPGSYSVEFRVKNEEHASGIYYYRLQSDSFSETKKIILMK